MEKILNSLLKQEERLLSIENLLVHSKNVLNIEEACFLTGLSKSTVYKFTSAGKIPFYKQAKHLYFKRTEIEDWLLANRGFNLDEIEKEASTYLTLMKKEAHKPIDRTQLKPKRMNTGRLGKKVSKGITEENQDNEVLESTAELENLTKEPNSITELQKGGTYVR